MKRAWKGYALILPMLAGFLLFYVVPFGQVVWDSLSQGTGKASSSWAWKITAGCSKTTCSCWPSGIP